uniref:Band 7 domain-containing protein n=1 Tax=Florenciella parvula TaxID=236787 RepID=A0A7S2BRL8_9STRA|mmetsp:Transcript_19698/g.41401  ORF Transcript_19698/g.41401 Transcript_19698/m.41401 type:complete len:286 (+) Transcript_19698:156-1013(+)|eukprot:CAMPEP_0119528426 /NCGR_PEP_ID=MMETSP1344-20130328/42623_1 /TAXON_ID=236787 /ORGANISM="Florenciella parvula, Strain CCMP2471" /LENGTH=285 /DNA_ID=CAMNT_0007567823 /DNA_START=185 /DNA_END=1042 /DNA_ORIENTATION=-
MSGGCCCVQCIQTSEIGIVERLGKYDRLQNAGINFFCCPIEYLAGKVSLRVQALDVRCETKTEDNVFVEVNVSVQYQVQKDKIYDAFYRLSNPTQQIRAYVFDIVRSVLPAMPLDEAFEAKEHVALEVKKALSAVMDEYGFVIVQALVTDIAPDAKVKNAMNEINASKRMKEAASEKAEADKVLLVKAAEADAESKYLSGVGVARQRKAIVDGLRDSIKQFSGNVQGTTPKDVIDLLLLTQYFDMLKEVGNHEYTATVFLPSESANGTSMRDSLLQAQAGQSMMR